MYSRGCEGILQIAVAARTCAALFDLAAPARRDEEATQASVTAMPAPGERRGTRRFCGIDYLRYAQGGRSEESLWAGG